MELVLIVFNQLLFMIILILIGFLLVKLKLLSNEGANSITNIILYITNPIVIIGAHISLFDIMKVKKFLISFLISIFIHALFILLSKIFKMKDPVDINAATISNSGFIGVPLISATFGEEAVFYLSTFMVINYFITWTFTVKLYSPNQKNNLENIIKSPVIVSVFLGWLLFLTQIKLPYFILTVFNSIKNLNTPLAMFVLGSYIANIDFADFQKDVKSLMLPTFYKLILFPLIALIVIRYLPDSLNELKAINMIAAASPSAINVALFAKKYNADYKKAAKLVCLSTILCIITIPVFVFFLGL